MLQRMKTLIAKLTEADIAYYKNDAPIMTDRDYDLLYDELTQLESSTGVILAGSPTQKVSGEILEELTEVRHTRPMLSAGKVKTDEEILQFMDGRPVVMSWKLDGLTLVLRYENGDPYRARHVQCAAADPLPGTFGGARRRRGQLGQLQPAQRNAG